MSTNKNKLLGNTIRELRVNNHLTQEFVASKINRQRSTYSYYESGKTQPDLDTLKLLAKMFNVSSDYFFFEKKEKALLGENALNSQSNPNKKTPASMSELTKEEAELVVLYRIANSKVKRKVATALLKCAENLKVSETKDE